MLILKHITESKEIAKNIADLGAVPNIVTILDERHRMLQKLAAEIIANVSKRRKPRRIVRKSGGLPKLVFKIALLNDH